MRRPSYLYWKEKELCWRVSIIRRGHRYENRFSVAKYGSQNGARVAAVSWRDEVYASLSHRKIKRKEKRNRSGVIGVRLCCKTNSAGKQYWSWEALWRQNGRNCRRKFSVLKYGNALARRLAIEIREQKTSQDHGG